MRILSVGGMEGPAVVGRIGGRAARRAAGVAVEIRVDRQRVVSVAAAVVVVVLVVLLVLQVVAGQSPQVQRHPTGHIRAVVLTGSAPARRRLVTVVSFRSN